MFWLPGTEKPFCHLRMSFSKPQKPFFVALMILTIVITAGPIVLAEPSKAGTHSSKSNDVKAGSTLTGKASFYSDSLNGHKTAKGESFHQSDHTAASNRLPLGTQVKVTNLKNDKSTDLTVTDRGPALGQNKIDLSKKAAKEIGLTSKQGVTPVKIKVSKPPSTDTAPEK